MQEQVEECAGVSTLESSENTFQKILRRDRTDGPVGRDGRGVAGRRGL